MPGGFGAGAGLDMLASTWDTGMNLAANSILQASSQNEAWKLYNYNNEYNTPLNQKKRYEEAGINPYAAMMQGQLTSGNSNSPAQTIEPPYGDYSPGLSGIVDRASQRELNEANARNLNAEAALNETDARTRSFENIARIDNLKKQGLISDAEYTRLMNENNNFGIRLEKELRALDDAHDLAELEKGIQRITAEYLPDIKEAELKSLQAQSAELFAAARANDAAAVNSIAQSMVAKAQEAGLKISNEVAQKTKVALVSEAFAKSREASKRDKIAGEDLKRSRGENKYGYVRVKTIGIEPKEVPNPFQNAERGFKKAWNVYDRNVRESTEKLKNKNRR